jgi:hypothetical protein
VPLTKTPLTKTNIYFLGIGVVTVRDLPVRGPAQTIQPPTNILPINLLPQIRRLRILHPGNVPHPQTLLQNPGLMVPPNDIPPTPPLALLPPSMVPLLPASLTQFPTHIPPPPGPEPQSPLFHLLSAGIPSPLTDKPSRLYPRTGGPRPVRRRRHCRDVHLAN